MKSIEQIVTDLNVARSNNCAKEKSEEIKSIINDLLPYEKEIKDYEWLKSKLPLSVIDSLADDKDKVKFLEIMGIKNEASNVND